MSATVDGLPVISPEERLASLWYTDAFMQHYRRLPVRRHQVGWCRRVDDLTIENQLSLEPRDHGKSEVYTISFVLRQICRNPRIRVLVVSNTATQAQTFLGSVKQELETNELIRRDFGDMTSIKSKEGLSTWGREVIYCQIPDFRRAEIQMLQQQDIRIRIDNERYRRKGAGEDPDSIAWDEWQSDFSYQKDATLRSVGMASAITGGHYDIIIFDDVQDDTNVKNPMRVDDMIGWLETTVWGMREPWTKMIVVGTRKGPADLYSRLIETGEWDHTIGKAIQWPDIDDITYTPVYNKRKVFVGVKDIDPPNIKVMWPEKWPAWKLLKEYHTHRTAFLREKQNSTRGYGVTMFDANDLVWYDDPAPPTHQHESPADKWSNHSLFVAIDPSIDNKRGKNDFCAMASGLLDRQNMIMKMYRLYYSQLQAADIVDEINNFIELHWNELHMLPVKVTVESVASQAIHYQNLLRQGRFRAERTESRINKETRFLAMAPQLRAGRVQFPRQRRALWQPFINEWEGYPDGHDDAMDAVEFVTSAAVGEGVGDPMLTPLTVADSPFIEGTPVTPATSRSSDFMLHSAFDDDLGLGGFELDDAFADMGI